MDLVTRTKDSSSKDHRNLSDDKNRKAANLSPSASLSILISSFFERIIVTVEEKIPVKFMISALFVTITLVLFVITNDWERYYSSFFLSNSMQSMVAILLLFLLFCTHAVVITAVLKIALREKLTKEEISSVWQGFHSRTKIFSAGVTAFFTFKLILNSSLICYNSSHEAISLWERIKMEDTTDKSMLAIAAEWTKVLLHISFAVLSFIFSPVLRHMAIEKRVRFERLVTISHPDIPSSHYSFSKYVIDDATNFMMTLFFLSTCILLWKGYFSTGKPFKKEGSNNMKVVVNDPVAHDDQNFKEYKSFDYRPITPEYVMDDVSTITAKSRSRGGKKFKRIKRFFSLRKSKQKYEPIPMILECVVETPSSEVSPREKKKHERKNN